MKMRKMIQGDSAARVTTDRDLRFQNFSEDWVPPYKELRTALVDSYLFMKKRWDKYSNGSKVPAMMLVGGHPQPGPGNIVCYACGIGGHKRGDSVCDAKPNDIWDCAPEAWKSRQKRIKAGDATGKKKKNKNGNGKDKGRPGVCRNFNTGNGYCRYGDNCRQQTKSQCGGKQEEEEEESIEENCFIGHQGYYEASQVDW